METVPNDGHFTVAILEVPWADGGLECGKAPSYLTLPNTHTHTSTNTNTRTGTACAKVESDTRGAKGLHAEEFDTAAALYSSHRRTLFAPSPHPSTPPHPPPSKYHQQCAPWHDQLAPATSPISAFPSLPITHTHLTSSRLPSLPHAHRDLTCCTPRIHTHTHVTPLQQRDAHAGPEPLCFSVPRDVRVAPRWLPTAPRHTHRRPSSWRI